MPELSGPAGIERVKVKVDIYVDIYQRPECPDFHIVNLAGQFLIWSKDLQKRPKCTYIAVFIFYSKTPVGLWNLFPEVDIKGGSQNALKKVLNLAEK